MIKTFRRATLAAVLAVAAAAMAATGLEAQSRTRTLVVGQVVDARTKAPLAGAIVEVPGTHLEVVTGPDGQFRMRMRPGSYGIAISRLGYRAAIESWEIGTESLDVGIVELSEDAILLEALKVSVDRVERQRRSVPFRSRSFGMEELATNASFNAADFVATRAAFATSCGGASPERACIRDRGSVVRPCVVIDDAPVPGGMTVLNTYQARDFARMNVYRGGAFIQAYTPGYLKRLATQKYTPMPAHLQMTAYCRFNNLEI
ncbi:MAG TPA: carboxypeptidase-like regulatory domain-containing protein [Longimicrobium sp.]|nr:carboxypeptidase-like regulatory domain-containing protein [Longimicrobium sp.]